MNQRYWKIAYKAVRLCFSNPRRGGGGLATVYDKSGNVLGRCFPHTLIAKGWLHYSAQFTDHSPDIANEYWYEPEAFCAACYRKLSKDQQRALYDLIGNGYNEAVHAALISLKQFKPHMPKGSR